MHYFIDGYNLMFRVLRAGNDLKMQREMIIKDLSRKSQLLNIDVTLVFDAQYQTGDHFQTSHFKQLEIIFSQHGQTADELILQKLKHLANPQQQTVVTSDKKLAWLARLRHAKTESVDDFLKWLNARYKNKIKREKEPALYTPPIVKIPKKIEPVISSKSTVEECYDFYLEQFEANFKTFIDSHPIVETKEKKVKKCRPRKPQKSKREEGLSDMDHWKKAFERDPSLDD